MSRDYRCKWPGVFYLNVCSPCHFNSGQIKRTTYRLQIHLPFEFFAQFIRSIFNHVAHHTYTISLVSCDVLNTTTSALHNGISSLNASLVISLDVDRNSFAKSTRRKNTQDFSPLLHQNIWKLNCNSSGNQFLVMIYLGKTHKINTTKHQQLLWNMETAGLALFKGGNHVNWWALEPMLHGAIGD